MNLNQHSFAFVSTNIYHIQSQVSLTSKTLQTIDWTRRLSAHCRMTTSVLGSPRYRWVGTMTFAPKRPGIRLWRRPGIAVNRLDFRT